MQLKKVTTILHQYIKNPEKEFQTAQILSNKLNVIIRKDKTKSDLAGFLHGAMGSVVPSTWIKAIKNNQFTTWPGLTGKLVKKHLIPTIADNFGFALAARRRFKVISANGMSLSHSLMGKSGSTDARIALK